ncbi:MAG TPA: MarR family transcriptional regulator [Thiolinea sp.]|nr:MarR family transcriptional regulator [Thiolinea sp.]
MTKPSPAMETVGFLLTDISRLMRQAFQRHLEGTNLTLAQARVLLYVARHESFRQIELAELLEVQPMNLVRLIDQLVQAGLVERHPDPLDRRAYQIKPTEAAKPVLEHIQVALEQVRAEMRQDLSDQDYERLKQTLIQVRDNLLLTRQQ